MKNFSALICGYGVPKDILKDKNYHAYLTACFNSLFDLHQNNEGVIIINGGPTDCYKPYRRTEAGEMAKWLKNKKIKVEKIIGKKLPWKIVSKPKSLSSVENLLNFKPFSAGEKIIFCERVRAPRIKKLARKIFGRGVKIIPVDFDASARRYTHIRTKASEQDFLRMELLAISDRKALAKLRAFMKKKLAIMRQYPAQEAHQRLPQILEKLHQELNK